MKKKLFFVLITIVLLFIGNNKSYAFDCSWEGKFEYSGSVGVERISFNTGGEPVLYTNGKKFTGKLTVEFNPQNASQCPEKIYLYNRGNQFFITDYPKYTSPAFEGDRIIESDVESGVHDNSENVIYDNYDDVVVSCGDGLINNIPAIIPRVVNIAYTLIQVAVPVVLVIMGSLDLFKGITAQKEDEIKKGQQMFVKRLVVAALVFFVFVIVKVIISFVAEGSGSSVMDCAQCFIENECD